MSAVELSERELAILRGLAAGRTVRQIARELDRKPATLDASVRSLFRKLDAVTEAQAVHVAHQVGLLGQHTPPAAAEPVGLRRVWDHPDLIARRRQVLNEAMSGSGRRPQCRSTSAEGTR
jgi:DNA-binding CsgD family transcriptional regulator